MAQESLHRAQRRSYAIEERRMGMPERVPSDAVKLQPLHSGRKLPPKQVAAAKRRTTPRSEHQGAADHNLRTAGREDGHRFAWQRHRALTALRFGFVKVAFIDGLANPQ